MNLHNRQRGFGLFSLIFLILLAVFIYLGAKIVPVYVEHYFVQQTLQSLKQEYQYQPGTSLDQVANDVKEKLNRYFAVNNVKNVSAQQAVVNQQGNILIVTLKYDVNIPLVANLDALAHFDDTVIISPKQ